MQIVRNDENDNNSLFSVILATIGNNYCHFVIHCCIFYTFINSYFLLTLHIKEDSETKRGFHRKRYLIFYI